MILSFGLTAVLGEAPLVFLGGEDAMNKQQAKCVDFFHDLIRHPLIFPKSVYVHTLLS